MSKNVDVIKIGNVTLEIVWDEEWEEWIVEWWDGDEYSDEKAYYTDDEDDARGTMKAMAEQETKRQKGLFKGEKDV